jgi:hypothetical protein
METSTTAEAMEADALDRHAELRADGRDHAAALPDALRHGPRRSPAEWAYQRVILYLKAFEEELANSEEVAMGFAGGAGGILRIEGIGFHGPDIVTFSGVDSQGRRAQLIQHVGQLNVLLRAVPRPEDRPEPRRIGFRLARALEEAQVEDGAEPAGGRGAPDTRPADAAT